MTYRYGSKGEQVKLLQRLLGVTVDGDFGRKTTEAVKAWQSAHGLVADGIAGPKTLARLCDVDITHTPISVHVTRYSGRPIQYIAIHYTASATSRAGSALAYRVVFSARGASADFVVDDATIVQVSPGIESYYCWAVGDAKNKWTGGARLYGRATNRNTISIEMCSNLRSGTTAGQPNHEGWSLTDAVTDRTLRLVRYLMLMYGVPKANVVRHYDITGKLCPGVPGWNDGPLFTIDGKQTTQKSGSGKWMDFWGKI